MVFSWPWTDQRVGDPVLHWVTVARNFFGSTAVRTRRRSGKPVFQIGFLHLQSVPFRWILCTAAGVSVVSGCGTHPFYHVRPGDTLYSISWQHGYHYRDVARWNGIAPPYVIRPGETLRVAPPVHQRDGTRWTLISKRTVAHRAPAPPSPSRSQSYSQALVEPAPRRATPAIIPSSPALRWLWPTQGRVVRTFTSPRHGSKGVDIAGNFGQPVQAAAAGKVVYSGNGLKGYGNLVIIKHNDRYLSAYAHNTALLVKEGQYVRAGEPIARMGRTSRNDTLLHFEIRRDGKPVDPLEFLPERN